MSLGEYTLCNTAGAEVCSNNLLQHTIFTGVGTTAGSYGLSGQLTPLTEPAPATPLIDALVDLIVQRGWMAETLTVLKALSIHPAATDKLKALVELSEVDEILG